MGSKKLIGYWITGFNDTQYCAPQELVGNYSSVTKSLIVAYLNGGELAGQQLGYSWCRFSCDNEYGSMGSQELTDGVWMWPQGLAHYVEKHDVMLPDAFIADATTKEPIPRNYEAYDYQRSHGDVSFWVAWCKRHANGKIAARIKALRPEADRKAYAAACAEEEKLKQAYAEEEKKLELSNNICLWAGCNKFTEEGYTICKWHQRKHSNDTTVSSASDNIYRSYFRKAMEVEER